ncbi:DUF5693 family protein [Tepidibacter mesophilus]|uniref:DUF5693 family protein n=1 Tax=Tepidibacter mesophilus TaxID=655607 RepID=UPI000C088A21|nr:DUF5693 family protein [Tepidibacter mesophilus]
MKVNRLFSIFLIIGILFSSVLVFERNGIESEYKNVEIVLDYDQLLKMKEGSDEDLKYFLNEFKDMKVSSVAINEATINTLKNRKEYKIKTSIDGYDLIVSADEGIYSFILEGFKRKIGQDRVEAIDSNTIRVKGESKDYIYDETKLYDVNGDYVGMSKVLEGSKLEFLGIGFLQEDIDIIKSSGLEVLPRPIYLSEYEDEKSIKYYFEFLDEQGINPSSIIFAGGEVLGFDSDTDYLQKELKSRNMVVGMIETNVQRENIDQKGLNKLVEDSGYYATRVFNVWDWLQERYDYEIPYHHQGQEIINSMYRAVTERNVRIIYFKPFIDKQGKYVTDMSIYKQRFEEFDNRIQKGHNMKIGKVNSMREVHPNRLMHIPIAIGIIAAFLILIDNLVNINPKYMNILFGLSSAGTAALYWLGVKADLLDKMFALLATIAMPSISMAFILYVVRAALKTKNNMNAFNILVKGIITLIIACMISLIGVLFETSLLLDSKFLLEMDIFRGVKVSQLSPIMLTVLLYLSIFGYKREKERNGICFKEIIKLFKEDIKIGHAIVLGVFLVIGIVFIARTGHETNIKPSSIELLFRNMLELVLTARPRNKSFLMANPAFILMMYLAFKGQKWPIFPLSLLVVIGQGNIVNTFSHIRAPLYLSYIRTNYEIVFGIIIGGIVTLLIDFIWRKIEGRKINA